MDTSSVSREFTLQFPLASIENPVLIRNIFYEFDSAELLESSCLALDSLVDLLTENPNVTIELAAHCDFRGKDEYNERLSQRRAESVVRYLIGHGIDSLRLTPVGYGEKRPKVVTRRMAATHDFLHEGDTLSEAFILALEDEEKQEICHALNRRTEFKVLRTTYKLFDMPEQTAPDATETASPDPSEGGENGGEEFPPPAENSEEQQVAPPVEEKEEISAKEPKMPARRALPERKQRPETKERRGE